MEMTSKNKIQLANRPHITCYTDGSYIPSKGAGGYCAYLGCGTKSVIIAGTEYPTTINRMEVRAVLEALRIIPTSCIFHIYSDSKYVVNTISKGWIYKWRDKGWKHTTYESVPNKDLWMTILKLLDRHTVYINWVKGHSGVVGNELCDEVASMQSRSMIRYIEQCEKMSTIDRSPMCTRHKYNYKRS